MAIPKTVLFTIVWVPSRSLLRHGVANVHRRRPGTKVGDCGCDPGRWLPEPDERFGHCHLPLRSYNPITEAWTTNAAAVDTTGRLPPGLTAANIASHGIVAGAIDPLSGNSYWAYHARAQRGGSITFFGWNTSTNTSLGVVATYIVPRALPSTGNANGDFAFDSQGNILVVSNVGTSAALGGIEGPSPTIHKPARRSWPTAGWPPTATRAPLPATASRSTIPAARSANNGPALARP